MFIISGSTNIQVMDVPELSVSVVGVLKYAHKDPCGLSRLIVKSCSIVGSLIILQH